MCLSVLLSGVRSLADAAASQDGAEVAEHKDNDDPDGKPKEDKGTIAQYLDKRLEDEFKNEELASQTKTDLNETLNKEKACTLATTEQGPPCVCAAACATGISVGLTWTKTLDPLISASCH